MTIKGKSDKTAFKVSVDQETLLGFLAIVLDKSNLEYDDDLATSPGGLPTAIFTSIVPASAREAVGWDLATDGWDTAKAIAAFDHRLERRAGGGFSLESRIATWEKKVQAMTDDFIGFGASPEAARAKALERLKKPESKA